MSTVDDSLFLGIEIGGTKLQLGVGRGDGAPPVALERLDVDAGRGAEGIRAQIERVGRGLVERFPCPEDGRATNARLTETGWDAVVAAAPGHVATVRRNVLDPLTSEQVAQLRDIGEALLTRLDPHGRMTALYDREREQAG